MDAEVQYRYEPSLVARNLLVYVECLSQLSSSIRLKKFQLACGREHLYLCHTHTHLRSSMIPWPQLFALVGFSHLFPLVLINVVSQSLYSRSAEVMMPPAVPVSQYVTRHHRCPQEYRVCSHALGRSYTRETGITFVFSCILQILNTMLT